MPNQSGIALSILKYHERQFREKSEAWKIKTCDRNGDVIHFQCEDGQNGTFSLLTGSVNWHKDTRLNN